MNEELKIIIKAVTADAKKSLADVKKELANIESESGEAKKSITEAMAAIAKGTAAAVGAVAALTAGMAKLGRSAQDVNKGFSRLKSSFENAGSDAKQATKYYKELFGVLGDHDRTVETGQSIARITTDPTALNDYKNIMAGAVSQYGDGYNSEALAENISETVASAQVIGDLERVLVEAGISVDGFNAALQQTTNTEQREIMVRNTLNGLLGAAGQAYINANQATIAYNQSQANLNVTLAEATRYTTPLLTELNNLSATLLTFLGPALQVVATYLTAFIQLIIEAIQWVGSFFGLFSGSSSSAAADVKGYQAAMNNYLSALRNSFGSTNNELENTNDKIKELKKQTMGFDELNIVSNPATASGSGTVGGGGGGGIGSIPTAPNPADYGIGTTDFGFEDMKKDIEEAKEKIKGLLMIVAAVAATFGLWKLIDFITEIVSANKIIEEAGDNAGYLYQQLFKEKAQKYLDDVTDKLKLFGGWLMIIAGAILLVQGYSDAWVNGIDWGNLATVIGGISLVVGGIALVFGPLAAGIAAIVGGIALVVLGVKDFIENGYSMQNVLMILAGILAIVVGVFLALNIAIWSNPVFWIIAGIAALVAAFVILWNECDGFRQFWIGLWEKAKVLFAKFVESIQPLIDAIVFAFQQAWELIKVIWMDYLVPMFKAAWEAIKVVWDVVKPYFEMIWNNIKTIFSIVGDVIGGYFRVAWEIVKAVWNVVVSYFTTIIKNIGLAFGVVKDLLSGNFSAAWDKIKQIFSNVGGFFKGVVNTIVGTFKNIASIVGDTISSVVKKAINGVLSTATTIINGFISAINLAISVINAIPGVEIKKLNKLEVPKLATGGILTKESLFVGGEGGKREAVLPLDQNTEWMDILADRIAGRTSSPSKLVLMVDGKELGWASINGINGITRQTGTLPLELALV